ETDLEICVRDFGMKVLRLHPNYHQYSFLEAHVPRMMEARGAPNYQQYHMLHAGAQALLAQAREHRFVVLLSVGLEDPRFHHWLCRVPNVTPADVAEAANGFPDVPLVVCGATFSEVVAIRRLAYRTENLYFENSRIQGPLHDVEALCQIVGERQLLFG